VSLAPSLHAELVNLVAGFYCVVKVLFLCGFIAVPIAIGGYELWKLGRTK
jgi:hypothetical protein